MHLHIDSSLTTKWVTDFIQCLAHGQHFSSPRWAWRYIVCMTSMKEGTTPVAGATLSAISMAATVFELEEHGQHAVCSWASQADFSHCNSHLGRAQLVGFTHLCWQSSSSQTGEHLGSGAVQVVWHWGGAHTVSQCGQESFSHSSAGQRMLQTGLSQWTTHLAQGV